MKLSDQARFNSLCQQQISALHLQCLAPFTIDAYSRAVRRVSAIFVYRSGELNNLQSRD